MMHSLGGEISWINDCFGWGGGGGLVWFGLGERGRNASLPSTYRPPLFPTPGLYQMGIDKTFESESGKRKKAKSKKHKAHRKREIK